MQNPLEIIWDALLSRQPDRVRTTFDSLDPASQDEVVAHLRKMVTEEGWHPEQVKSARAALKALGIPKHP